MKKFTFVLMMMLAYAGFTMAQTIENFESPFQMHQFSTGLTGYVTTAANPDSSVANPSLVVGQMHRTVPVRTALGRIALGRIALGGNS